MCAKKLQESVVRGLLGNTPVWLFVAMLMLITAAIVILLASGSVVLRFGDIELKSQDYRKIARLTEISTEILSIDLAEGKRISEQKLAMNDAINEMIEIVLDFHQNFIKEKGFVDGDVLICPQYLHYQAIVDNAMDAMKIKGEIKLNEMAKQFGINDKDSSRWTNYRDQMAGYFVGEFGRAIQARWINLGIGVDENYAKTRAIVPQIIKILQDFFDKCFLIQVEYELKKIELKAEQQQILEEI